MTFEEVYQRANKIYGWIGPEDGEALYNAVKDIKDGLIVEIGAYAGRSTTILALSSPSSTIITIDEYPEDNFPGDRKPFVVKKDFLKNIKGLNVYLIQAMSELVSWELPIDFLHIDGDHRYKAVKKDIDLFAPHVKSGQYVYLHDYEVKGDPERIISLKDTKSGEKELYYDKEYGIVRAVNELKEVYFDQVTNISGFAACRRK